MRSSSSLTICRRLTLLVAPTPTFARQASFRPEIEISGQLTRVLAEQTAAIDPGRLGPRVGYLSHSGVRRIDAALSACPRAATCRDDSRADSRLIADRQVMTCARARFMDNSSLPSTAQADVHVRRLVSSERGRKQRVGTRFVKSPWVCAD
jgi:hypothetical protein